MTDYSRSIVRTIVPLIVGTIVGWLATRGIEVDRVALTGVVDPIIAAAYYAVVRIVEQHAPWAGWLLGAPGAPSYGSRPGPDADPA